MSYDKLYEFMTNERNETKLQQFCLPGKPGPLPEKAGSS